VIVIDDLRLCQSNQKLIQEQYKTYPDDTNVLGYPSLSELRKELLNFNKDYRFYVYGDVGFIFPANIYQNITVSPVVQAMTSSRFFEENEEHSIEDIYNVIKYECNIIHAKYHEAEAIKMLLDPIFRLYIPELFTAHYRLWNGLVLLGEGKYNKAKELIQSAYELGLKHWRIIYYIAYIEKLSGNFKKAQRIFNSIEEIIKKDGLYLEKLPALKLN
jgi:hypothetical protein